ncbi:MAG: winged helix-turn-helix domain-containing protein [Myxococcales bacterium]|nr:winged helix-turn-helix domain-containing protein [Myxococcales bacterium]MDD9968685.1 winged helix-turn-helix domain-containing protein [Myxococcales bacterium]
MSDVDLHLAASWDENLRAPPLGAIYRFDAFSLHLRSRELWHHDSVVPLEPQNFDVLAWLIANRARLVSRHELLTVIWRGRAVSAGVVRQAVFHTRRALDDCSEKPRLIKTYPRRGYRFVASVVTDPPGSVYVAT